MRDGILHHSKGRADLSIDSKGPATLEGKVVKISDRVAYINHDIDDAIRAGIITEHDLPAEAVEIVGRSHAERVGSMVIDIIRSSEERNAIGMSEPFREATDRFKDFLFAEVYGREIRGITELRHAGEMLKDLFRFYIEHPEEVPEIPSEDDIALRARRVCDLISGMTDRYAQKDYTRRFLKWL